jgi:hypothetical protein
MNNEEKELSFAERFSEFTTRAVSVAPLVAALGIAVWWIFFGTIEITQLHIGIVERIGLTIVTIVMALTYRKLISTGGFEDGKKIKDYQTEFTRWRANCKKYVTEKASIQAFVEDKCKTNVRELIAKNLERNSLIYSDYFNDEGVLINTSYETNKDLTRHQKRIIRKCVRMKVHVPDIFTIDNEKYLGIKRRESEREFKTKTDAINTTVTTVLAFFSTGIMFAFVGFSKGSWIYALFQIALWTGTGVMGRIKNYNHVVKKQLNYIIENSDLIEEYAGLPQNKKDEFFIKAQDNNKKIKMITMKEER